MVYDYLELYLERYFWNGLIESRALESLVYLESYESLVFAKYSNVLVEKRTLVEKILNLKPNCIYSMQFIKQHYYRETEEQNCEERRHVEFT